MLRTGYCRYFTGIAAGVCEQAMPYRQFAGYAYPCIPKQPTDTRVQATCPLHSLPSAEEVEVEEQRLDQALREYLGTFAARQHRGECGHCGTPMEAKVQVGRCIYAQPCGCRVGQGRLMQDGKPVQKIVYTPPAQQRNE
jgi:hypothetical protein